MSLQDAHGRDLVLRHETAVTHSVGAQDGRQSTNDGVGVHPAARRPSKHQRELGIAVASMVDSMTVLYLPPNASVLAGQKEVLTGWPSSPGPPPPARRQCQRRHSGPARRKRSWYREHRPRTAPVGAQSY